MKLKLRQHQTDKTMYELYCDDKFNTLFATVHEDLLDSPFIQLVEFAKETGDQEVNIDFTVGK